MRSCAPGPLPAPTSSHLPGTSSQARKASAMASWDLRSNSQNSEGDRRRTVLDARHQAISRQGPGSCAGDSLQHGRSSGPILPMGRLHGRNGSPLSLPHRARLRRREKSGVRRGLRIALDVDTEVEFLLKSGVDNASARHDVYFNRGVIGSQALPAASAMSIPRIKVRIRKS